MLEILEGSKITAGVKERRLNLRLDPKIFKIIQGKFAETSKGTFGSGLLCCGKSN